MARPKQTRCGVFNKVTDFAETLLEGECGACSELDGIRADLLVNYGMGRRHATAAWGLLDAGTTRNMVVTTLGHQVNRITEYRALLRECRTVIKNLHQHGNFDNGVRAGDSGPDEGDVQTARYVEAIIFKLNAALGPEE